MSEKENRLVRVDPTGEGSMLQYTLNQALNKRESFLSGVTGGKLANGKPNFGRNRNSNKSNHLARDHGAHSKASLLSLQQVQHRFGGPGQPKSSAMRQRSGGDAGVNRLNSTGAQAKPTLRLGA